MLTLLILLIVIASASFIVLGVVAAVGEEAPGVTVLAFTLVLICVAISFSLTHELSYRAGQIDALNGKVEYQLVEQDNGEKTWELLPYEQRQH